MCLVILDSLESMLRFKTGQQSLLLVGPTHDEPDDGLQEQPCNLDCHEKRVLSRVQTLDAVTYHGILRT